MLSWLSNAMIVKQRAVLEKTKEAILRNEYFLL